MKKCKICGIEKKFEEFNNRKDSKDGLRNDCKSCHKQKTSKHYSENKEYFKDYYKGYREDNKESLAEYMKKYSFENSEKLSEYKKKYYEENSEKLSDYKKKYYEENCDKLKEKSKKYREKNKEHIKEKSKKYREKNKEKINERNKKYTKNRQKVDLVFKLSKRIRSMISTSISKSGYKKESKTFEILGCSFDDFKVYIELKFESWMNWYNYGTYTGKYSDTWQLDHIIPISSSGTIEDIYKLNHFSNLQPLCSRMNLEKSNNLTYDR